MKPTGGIFGPCVAISALLLASPGTLKAESPALWNDLAPGTYKVGFKTLWQLDYSRSYNTVFADKTTYATGKAPRPILVNLWYPAEKDADGKRMPHRAYLEIKSSDAQLAKFSTALAEYNREVIAKEVLGKAEKDLSKEEKQLLDQFLDTPTASLRNAAPAKGKFPLVLYHSGHGSSFEDNSVLCEYLASHGYVVLGSAFQHASGKSFNVDSKEGSARDFEFLIAYAHKLANVDWDHIGVVGHSGGAHAALFFRSQGNSVVDAVVSLDTTQDYYSLTDPRWQYLTDAVGNNRDNMTGPLLMVANPHAFFQMADSLKSARRYYFTIKGLDHNDFISQGGIRKDLQYRRRFGDGAKGEDRPAKDVEAKEKADLDAVRAGYKALCVYILRYFDAHLKGDAAGKDFLAKQHRDTKLGGADPHVEYVPEGTTEPDPYKGNEDVPPTPRQLRLFLREHGVEKTVALLNRFQKAAPTPPALSPIFGFALIYELLDQGKNEDAIAFRNAYREGGADIVCKMLMSHGDLYVRLGSKKWAADFFKKVLALEPDNAEAVKKLKELEK